jgi:hypothetical protein
MSYINLLVIFNMVDNSESSSVIGEKDQAKRQYLHRVMIDTSALLNMVKHCRDSDWKAGALGSLMGVLKDDQTLLITQTRPDVSRLLMAELNEAMEKES